MDGKGNKVFEFNNMFGDPEDLVLLTLENDFVDVSFGMIEGNLPKLKFKKQPVAGSKTIKLDEKKFSPQTKKYPASINLKDNGEMEILSSRSVLIASVDTDLERAFER